MSDLVKDTFVGMPWYLYCIIILSFGLMVASFIVPPLGAINPTVLQGVAIILGFTWLLYTTVNIPVFISRGAKIRASYGDAKLEIAKHQEKEEENNNDDDGDNI